MDFLKEELGKVISKPNVNLADELIYICQNYFDKPVHNMTDLKKKNQKLKGDIFECFCLLYMKYVYKLEKIWLLHETPEDVLLKVGLKRKDMGIDLIGQDKIGDYYAIQAKYRKRNKNKKTTITWKQLSTFYALVLKTGPFKKHIVFTNADSARHVGNKTDKDLTITYNRLNKITHFEWLQMLELETKTDKYESSVEKKKLSIEQIRQKRLLYFSKNHTIV
ncbi:Restriction endonuclease [seawater metagenome]|uniref:Restriction endonuclease n=1 Tax=seawater metagenome TaxID=1561972 RepID=A0A5E8CJB5_9ZZZZ